ncbi:MAG: hypothetical protein ABWX68_00600 [Arthrobacter sp.]|uniref:hypothetical protein n=1 Tax=Arthrobacter sp. TaxID=1667 RepID=UPI0034857578
MADEYDASEDRSNHPRNQPTQPVDQRPQGLLLGFAGLIIALLFGIFIWLDADQAGGLATPMWIGVLFGLIIAGFGFFRRIHGPSKLDFPDGGSNVSE